ncbi:hypothetical protein MMC32_001447 [Xylographa parallela]|nr:hypothetical protein [Xylographa parallela]
MTDSSDDTESSGISGENEGQTSSGGAIQQQISKANTNIEHEARGTPALTPQRPSAEEERNRETSPDCLNTDPLLASNESAQLPEGMLDHHPTVENTGATDPNRLLLGSAVGRPGIEAPACFPWKLSNIVGREEAKRSIVPTAASSSLSFPSLGRTVEENDTENEHAQ